MPEALRSSAQAVGQSRAHRCHAVSKTRLTESLLFSRPHAKHFACTISFNFSNVLLLAFAIFPHFTDEKD